MDSAKLNMVDKTHPALVKSSVAKKAVLISLIVDRTQKFGTFQMLLLLFVGFTRLYLLLYSRTISASAGSFKLPRIPI